MRASFLSLEKAEDSSVMLTEVSPTGSEKKDCKEAREMKQITDLEELIARLHLYCVAEGKRPKTISWYIPKAPILRDYLRCNNMPTNPTLITSNHLRAFLVHLSTEVTKRQTHPLNHD